MSPRISIEDLNSQFYQLSEVDFVISNGYCYKLDWDQYDSIISHARQLVSDAVDEENLRIAREFHLSTLEHCDIIDEDGKICGEYFTSKKEYKIFYWRFLTNGKVYYRDEYDNIWSYGNSYIGHLKDDGDTLVYDN